MTSIAKLDAAPAARRIFTADRLFAYPLIFLAVYTIATIAWVALSANMVDPREKPLGYDFITFWAGSWLSLHENPASVFDPDKIFAAEQIAVPASEKMFLWHYPPTFLLVVTPLALLPYLAAFFLWGGVTFSAYAWVIRKMAPQPQTMLLLVAFPGTFLNFFHGQNGFITGALLGAGLMAIERRPILAGILIGLMSYKPHLGVLLPLALLCGRHWQAFAAAAVTTLLFAGLSALILGTAPWVAFWNNLPLARAVFEDGLIHWGKLPSLYAALRLAGAGIAAAYVLHALLALCVTFLVARVWWLKPSVALRTAVLSTGALLVTPYLFNYDYAILAIPIALLAMDGYVRGWMKGERTVLVVAWVMPLVAVGLAEATSVQIGPLCVAALFAVAVRRALLSAGGSSEPQARHRYAA